MKGTLEQWKAEEEAKKAKLQSKLADEKKAREEVIQARRAKLEEQRQLKAAQEVGTSTSTSTTTPTSFLLVAIRTNICEFT